MPWNGSAPNQTFSRSDGTRNGTTVWQQADADGVDIIATDHDEHDQDLAGGLNAALKKDGGNTPTANLPMGSYRHTNVGEPIALANYQTLKGALNGTHRYVANVGGSANAITLTTGFSVPAYVAGQQLSFVVEAINTAATTVDVDSIGVKAVKRLDGTDLQAGDLYAGAIAVIEYDGTNFQLLNRRVVEGSGDGGSMTGAEIEAALNTHLGNEDWQAIATTQIIPAVNADGRVTVTPTVNGHGGAKFGMAGTADGRLMAWGDVAAFAFNPVGDAYGAYEIPVPWDVSTVAMEAIYFGIDYALVLTNEATGNLYAIGGNGEGQCGDGTTTDVKALKKIAALSAVHIQQVWTEGNWGNAESAWFALTSTGTLYSCGAGDNYTMGNNATADVLTPRLMTQSDGTTPLANIAGVAFATVTAPVMAWTTDNKLWRWGSGRDGAHGNNNTSDMTWPDLLETSPGSGTDRTDIAAAAVMGDDSTTARAVAWILTTANKIEVSGDRDYGSGDGNTSGTPINVFTPAAGAIDSETVTAIYAGGGERYNCIAITAAGDAWIVGRMADMGLAGDGGTTDLNTFTQIAGGDLPTNFDGNITGAVVAGGGNSGRTAIYLEATIGGKKSLASIGYDNHYATAKNTTGVAAADQTYGLVQGVWGTIAAWGVFGEVDQYGLWVLNSDGELRYAGRNDQGQAGMRHAPNVMANIPILQRVDLGVPRLLKPPTPRGSYSAVVEYSKQDVVTRSGSSWIYVNETASTGNAPPTLPTTSNSYWDLLAQKGDTGEIGIAFDFAAVSGNLTTGTKARFYMPFSGTITEATIIANTTGSIVFDVWKDTYANYPPTIADTITAAAKPTLSSADKSTDSTLTGWTTSVSAGDTFIANIDSVTGISNAVLVLKVQRS